MVNCNRYEKKHTFISVLTSVLDKASKSVWDLILDSNGLGKEISETVERIFCRLSGREPPLFPLNVETQSEKEKENEKGNEKEIENGKENLVSPLKKSKFDEMSYEEGAYEGASGSSKPPAMPEDSILEESLQQGRCLSHRTLNSSQVSALPDLWNVFHDLKYVFLSFDDKHICVIVKFYDTNDFQTYVY
ncbi:hypothetical protein HYC85_017121 [Camellia sinensis]|uniref:Uncharacterized protein n=1 Tax=Camellia sinensis TaxID=4442 RepID=A0A7J7H1M2_CAMSI|nr:hypothetical protein HYC85_017121 [Camellia sinensis]